MWRYLLKRDDDEPAPWTRDGKERIKKLGLTMQVEIIFILSWANTSPGQWWAAYFFSIWDSGQGQHHVVL